MHGFGLAVKLVAKALDIVHAVRHDDRVAIEGALDGGTEAGAGIFFRARGGVDASVEREGVVADVLEFQALDARLGGGGDAAGEVFEELVAAVRFAGFGVAGEEEELWFGEIILGICFFFVCTFDFFGDDVFRDILGCRFSCPGEGDIFPEE